MKEPLSGRLRGMKGLSECKASESNIRRIRVKDIVKKVKDYLKTYSPAGIDIRTAKEMWNDLILAHERPSDTRDTNITALRLKFNAFKSLEGEKDSDSDVKEDQRTKNKFMDDLNAEYHKRALLANQKRFYKRSTKIRAFMAIEEDEPSVGKADTRSGQWIDITMKKVHRLLSMTDGDERKHVLDYTHVDLYYVEDQRKKLVSKFNLLRQEISLHKSELSNLKSTMLINCSLQNEGIKVNLENESLKDEIIDLKKVIETWTCNKVTLDQLLFEKVPENIIKALEGKSRRKEKISSKEVVFTKADESSSKLALEITSDLESEFDSLEPLPPLPKLVGAAPSGTLKSLIYLSDMTLNMADLSLDTPNPKKTRPSFKVSPTYVIKKKTDKSPDGPKPCSDKKTDSSTEKLFSP
nr:hypothetical protein [Tanacetum cinerariifolium]